MTLAAPARGSVQRSGFCGLEAYPPVGGDSAAFGDRQEVWERDGTLIRLTRDRGQWWYDISRSGANLWLDLDGVAGGLGSRSTAAVERVADVASIYDRKFDALSAAMRHSP